MQMIHQVPDLTLTTTEIQTEARREVFRWVAEQVRSEFSTETWSVFWQTSIEGRCVMDVALASGRTPGAIYVARYRVLARIKERVHEVSQHWDLIEERGSS
jgi:RNA polymerase sigma-70 factor (ECF subfamily)